MEMGDLASWLGNLITLVLGVVMLRVARDVGGDVSDVMHEMSDVVHDLILLRKTAHTYGSGPPESAFRVKEKEQTKGE